ncbi:AI-2E family transporter, partial [Nocardioides sp.]|uniref:AI-2E family transporter n=1 Tax=Nocardioides sp. TaxID=35761 RepID=UPI0027341F58
DADPGRESDQSGRDQSGRDQAESDQAESDQAESDQPAGDPAEGRRWLQLKPAARRGRDEEDDDGLGERLTQQLAHQWALIRAERRAEPPPIRAGVSNFDRAQVPWGIDLAAAWAWRFLVILVAVGVIVWVAAYLAVITVPLLISLLIAALGSPLVQAWRRFGIPAGISALVVVFGGLAAVGALLTFVGQQVIDGFGDLADSVVVGLGEIRIWLRDGPLNASDSQINDYIKQLQESITRRTEGGEALNQVTEVGIALGHVLAGFFIVLFATYFFLADGRRIWSWFVRLAPRAARERIDTSGRVAWVSLTQFVRATVVVALVDAVGIMIVAKLLGVPFVLAIGVLVFLGAFVPMIGATIAGTVAVLVALVDQGPWTALLMLGGVILVQQVEGHVLQPFLMGRFVSLHPLGVIVAIGCGVLAAGVAGALFAVPMVAALNAVISHLAAYTDPGDDPAEQLDEDLAQEEPDGR